MQYGKQSNAQKHQVKRRVPGPDGVGVQQAECQLFRRGGSRAQRHNSMPVVDNTVYSEIVGEGDFYVVWGFATMFSFKESS